MEIYSQKTFLGLAHISRYILYLFFLFLILGAITGIDWIGVIAIFLVLISWITPGILLILRVPWFAYAWLRGLNPIWFTALTWEQLSQGKKFSVYFTSVVLFVFSIAAIIFYARR